MAVGDINDIALVVGHVEEISSTVAAAMTEQGAAMFQWVNAKGWVMVNAVDGALGAVRQRAAAALEVPADGAGVQYRDGRIAAGLVLSGLYGRMMPHSAMQKRVSPQVKNALDNAGNRQPDRAPNAGPRLQNT